MAALSVLLDSCVLFPMPLCDTLLRAAEAEIYRVHFSQEILDGATRNLVKKGRMTQEKAARFQEMIKNHFPEGMVEVPAQLVEIMTNHLGDRHVVAAAIIAQAEIIVTYNIKDFPVASLSQWGIEAWHPDDFLMYLDEQFPEKTLQIVRQQSEILKNPPITVVKLLCKLEQENKVSKFASSIRFREYCVTVVEAAKKTLNKLGIPAPEGGKCYEGTYYRLWQQGEIIIITAKDDRGEILRSEDGHIEGNLLSEDIEAFHAFAQRLEQVLAEDMRSGTSNLDSRGQ